jgi:threonine aldolase
MADRLAAGLTRAGRAPVWAVEANLVFVVLPQSVQARLKAAGAQFYVRSSDSLPEGVTIEADESLVRLVTSFATREAEVDKFVALAAI